MAGYADYDLASTPVTGDELILVLQNGLTKRVPLKNLIAYLTNSVQISKSTGTRAYQAGTVLHCLGQDDVVPRITIEGFGNTDPLFTVQAGKGTTASPTSLTNGSLIGGLNFRGYDSNADATRLGFSYGVVQLRVAATQDWGANAHGAKAWISTMPKNGPSTGSEDTLAQTWNDDQTVIFHTYSSTGNAGYGHLRTGSDGALAASRFLSVGAVQAVTIASDAATVATSLVSVDTEAAAASDNLKTITGTSVADGDLLVVRPASAARVVTVKDQAAGGNLQLNGDFVMSTAGCRLTLVWQATNSFWLELARSDNG